MNRNGESSLPGITSVPSISRHALTKTPSRIDGWCWNCWWTWNRWQLNLSFRLRKSESKDTPHGDSDRSSRHIVRQFKFLPAGRAALLTAMTDRIIFFNSRTSKWLDVPLCVIMKDPIIMLIAWHAAIWYHSWHYRHFWNGLGWLIALCRFGLMFSETETKNARICNWSSISFCWFRMKIIDSVLWYKLWRGSWT